MYGNIQKSQCSHLSKGQQNDIFHETSVRSRQHLRMSDLECLCPKYNDYYKFTIVRHPYTRMISEYFWSPVMGHKRKQSFNEIKNYEKIELPFIQIKDLKKIIAHSRSKLF